MHKDGVKGPFVPKNYTLEKFQFQFSDEYYERIGNLKAQEIAKEDSFQINSKQIEEQKENGNGTEHQKENKDKEEEDDEENNGGNVFGAFEIDE